MNRRQLLLSALATGALPVANLLGEPGQEYESVQDLLNAYRSGKCNGLRRNIVAGGPAPNDLFNSYASGQWHGVVSDQATLDRVLAGLKKPRFAQAAPQLAGDGKGKISLPYKSYLKYDRLAFTERQSTGDCVSHGTRNAIDVSRAVDIDINSKPFDFIVRGATEGIYGSRGHGGQGMSGAGAADWVHTRGGILLRQKYSFGDFTEYNGSIGASWGPRGVPSDVTTEAGKHRVGQIALITTIAEARDALANGYGLAVCSDYGFSQRRDSDGFASPSGNWSHCMAWDACDDVTFGETVFLVQNSWGKWNDGGSPAWGPLPDGSFLIRQRVAERMLAQEGCWVFSDVNGFPPRRLPDYGFDYA